MGGPHNLYEGINVPSCLKPDFLAQRMITCNCIFVQELITIERPRFLTYLPCPLDHFLNKLFRDATTLAGRTAFNRDGV